MTIPKSKLKRLETLRSNLVLTKEKQKYYNKKITQLQKEVNQLELELEIHEITFTDHALIRYLERFGNLDIKAITNNLIKEYEKLIRDNKGNCKIKHKGLVFIVKDYKIITILNS